MTERVAVLGGGVAGLTAAHELARARLRGHGLRGARPARRQGAQPAGAGLGSGRARRSPRRARLPLLPGLLQARARHDAAHRRRSAPRRRRARAAGAGGGAQRADHARAPAGVARGLRAGDAVRVRGGHEARRPAAGHGVVRGPAADPADELRRAAARAVGAPELVALRRRGPALAGVPEVPRRRAHAHAGGREGARDERAHRRVDPAAAALRPHARRRARGSRARRADQRRLDRPLGGASRGAGRRVPPRRAGPGHPDGGRARDRCDGRRRDGHRRPLRRGGAGRGDAAARVSRSCGPSSRGSSGSTSWSRAG